MSNTKPDSSQVKFIPAGAGAVVTTVQTELRKTFYSSNYPNLQSALTASAGNLLIIDKSETVSEQVTILAGTHLQQLGAFVITLAVPDVEFFIPDNSSNITIDGLIITGLSSRAISSNQMSGASNIRIQNCHITGCTGGSSGVDYTSGIFLSNVNNVWITNNIIKDCGAGLLEGFGGIVFYVGPNTFLHISGNRIESSVALQGIACFATAYSEIIGNTVTGMKTGSGNNNGYGVLLYDNAGYITNQNTIANNIISSTEGSGIYIVDANNTTITGNVCKFNSLVQSDITLPSAGISINGPNISGTAITGNCVSYSGQNGITIAGASTVSCSGNSINNCSQHGIHLRGGLNEITVVGNSILSSEKRGIFDDDNPKRGVSIVGNSLYNSGQLESAPGIEVNGSVGACVSGNVSSGASGAGLQVADDNYLITNNVLLDNSVVGIAGSYITSVRRGNKFTSGASQGQVSLVGGVGYSPHYRDTIV